MNSFVFDYYRVRYRLFRVDFNRILLLCVIELNFDDNIMYIYSQLEAVIDLYNYI